MRWIRRSYWSGAWAEAAWADASARTAMQADASFIVFPFMVRLEDAPRLPSPFALRPAFLLLLVIDNQLQQAPSRLLHEPGCLDVPPLVPALFCTADRLVCRSPGGARAGAGRG